MIVIGDLHYNIRRGNQEFHSILSKAFEDAIEECKEYESVVILGDIFDNRGSVDFKILNDTLQLFKKLSDKVNEIYILIGNHDLYYKENTEKNVNCRFLKNVASNIKIINEITHLKVENKNCLFIPWLDTPEKLKFAREQINGYEGLVFGHFDINGIYGEGIVSETSFSQDDFSEDSIILSGHYHKRKKYKNVLFVGSLISQTFTDVGNKKGIHRIDENNNIHFIENDSPIFDYLDIKNSTEFVESIKKLDSQPLDIIKNKIKGNFIKIYMNEYSKDNDEVYKIIKSFEPKEISVCFNKIDFIEDEDIEFKGFNQNSDIISIIYEYVDNIKDSIPEEVTSDKIKEIINMKNTKFLELSKS